MATEITPSPIWSLGSIDVDGLSDARRISHEDGYELANGTLAFTVTADSTGGRQGLFSKDFEYFGDGGHFTVWIEDGRILARLQSEDRSYELTGGDVNAGEPLAVAVTFGAGGFELYVGGELVDRSGYTGGLQGNREPIVVGASQWASAEQRADTLNHEFKGQISDMGLYDEALSAAEIRALADGGAAPEPEPQPQPDPDTGSGSGGNEAPDVADPVGTIAIGEGERQRVNLDDVFSDPDNAHLNVHLLDGPDFIFVNTNGNLVVDARDSEAGSYTVSLAASDRHDNMSPVYTTTLKIGDAGTEPEPQPEPEPEPEPQPEPEPEPAPTNSAPKLVGSFGTLTVDEGGTGRAALTDFFTDPDGDDIAFTLKGAPGFVSIGADGRLIAAPKDGHDGTYDFTVVASDGEATSPGLGVTLVVDDSITSGGGNGNGGVNGNGGGNSEPVTLTAGRGILTDGKVGPQAWGEGVTLNAYDLNGKQAEVRYSEQFDDHGFGVAGPGSRWVGQIDYYASGGSRSEKMVVDFNGDVTDVVLRVGMLGNREGPGATPESGTWKAYNAAGKLVDKGLIGPDQSMLGDGVKEGRTYGVYPIDIHTDVPIERLELEATQFDYGKGSSVDMSYGENSSDFNVMGLEFLRLEAVDDFLL